MKKIIFISFVLFSVFSCKKYEEKRIRNSLNLESSNPILAENLITFLDQDSDAEIVLQRYTMFNRIDDNKESFSSTFNSSYSGTTPSQVKVNSSIFNSTNNFSIQNLFAFSNDIYGTNLNILFDNDTIDNEFYSSEPIRITYNDTLNTLFGEGMTFNWNADTGSQGVVFYVIADNSNNPFLTSDITKSALLDDNGSFTIPSGWLSDFTSQNVEYIEVHFIRGNYKMLLTPNNDAVKVVSVSICYKPFFMQ